MSMIAGAAPRAARGSSLRHLHQQKETGIDLSLVAGGDDQTRTDYLYVANVSLYRVSYIPVQMLYYYTVFAPIFQSFLLAFRIIFQKNFLRARVRALYRGNERRKSKTRDDLQRRGASAQGNRRQGANSRNMRRKAGRSTAGRAGKQAARRGRADETQDEAH